jgi:hypothetical protein
VFKKALAAVVIVLPILAACGSDATVADPPVDKTDEGLKVCPYAIPYCAPDCKLVGGCPQQCVCGNTTKCGNKPCGKNEYCCNSTTVGYECLPTGYMCPL